MWIIIGIGWLARLLSSCVSLSKSYVKELTDFSGVLDTLGLQTGNTVLSAYIVDNYPEHANEVITFYTVIINVSNSSPFISIVFMLITPVVQLSAFINPWFIYYWIEASGKPHPSKACIEYSLKFYSRIYMDLCRSMHHMQLWTHSAVYSAAEIWRRAQEYAANVHQTYR